MEAGDRRASWVDRGWGQWCSLNLRYRTAEPERWREFMKVDAIPGSRLAVSRVILALFVLTAFWLVSVSASSRAVAFAQQNQGQNQGPSGRFRVLVVPISSEKDRGFGEKVAEMIRKRLEDFSTHAPVGKREFERALKRYDVKEEDLNAIKSRQLANLMGAQVVFYGTATPTPAGGFQVEANFIDVKTGDEVAVPATTVPNDKDQSVETVTDAAIEAFQKQVKFVRARQFCADYVGSRQPSDALRNCDEALAINPTSVPALFNKGLAYRQMFETDTAEAEQWGDSAVTYFEKVLSEQPGKPEALQNAAYIYSRLGQGEKASKLYQQYLELDPGNIPVRLKVAYDLAQADLMKQAIDVLQAGLQYDSTNVNLLQSLGDYSLRYSKDDSAYVDVALNAYNKVLDIKGEQTDLSVVENALAAYNLSGRTQDAIAFAKKALQAHSESPRLWSFYADALAKLERYSEATGAMDSVLAMDQSYPNGYLKRGRFKLEAGNEDGALADFQKAIDSGSSTQNDVYRFLWAQAHGAREAGKLEKAADLFGDAAKFAEAGEQTQEVQFWWGYTYYQMAESLAKPDKASLNALKQAQGFFQTAQSHFAKAGDVRKEAAQLRDATQKWLLNVEARIKRASTG